VRVEVLLAPEDLGRNLVLLRGETRVIHGMIRQKTQQFAKGLRAMQRMAAEELLDLSEILGSFSHGDHRSGIVTPR